MEEKTYKIMSGSGVMNVIMGISAIALGAIAGVMLIYSGVKLLSNRQGITF
ncbi:MAG: hypothetical protein HXK90_06655 [Lachnospiraceae bacterium]|jgi:hypothetical protein|nr:hypothetical protein [Lachnospiraceae bacterium]